MSLAGRVDEGEAGETVVAEETMAIIDDYAAIAAELRRKQAEKRPGKNTGAPGEPAQHRMRITISGEQLYRRLVAKERDGPLEPGRG